LKLLFPLRWGDGKCEGALLTTMPAFVPAAQIGCNPISRRE
jgi:hypothetical protein